MEHLLLSDQERGGDEDVLLLPLPDGRVDQPVADLSLAVARLGQEGEVLLEGGEEGGQGGLAAVTAPVQLGELEEDPAEVAAQ